MNNRSRVFQSIDLIEQNLAASMTLMEVAESTGFSYYYYSHLFKAITGLSPSTYMTQRRLAKSVEALLSTDHKIIDIAFDFGYGSPEAYSRAFSKTFGQSPSDVRKSGLRNGDRMLKPIHESTGNTSSGQPLREPELVTLDAFHLTGIPFYWDLSQKNDLSDQWQTLMTNLDMIQGIKEPQNFYQMQMWLPDQAPDTLYFFVAVETEPATEPPLQMTAKTIPAHTYLKFWHKGLANQVGQTYRFIYEEWLPRTDLSLPHMFSFEHYGEENLGPYNPESVTEIYIPVETGHRRKSK